MNAILKINKSNNRILNLQKKRLTIISKKRNISSYILKKKGINKRFNYEISNRNENIFRLLFNNQRYQYTTMNNPIKDEHEVEYIQPFNQKHKELKLPFHCIFKVIAVVTPYNYFVPVSNFDFIIKVIIY